jgi:hypothetical protein
MAVIPIYWFNGDRWTYRYRWSGNVVSRRVIRPRRRRSSAAAVARP